MTTPNPTHYRTETIHAVEYEVGKGLEDDFMYFEPDILSPALYDSGLNGFTKLEPGDYIISEDSETRYKMRKAEFDAMNWKVVEE